MKRKPSPARRTGKAKPKAKPKARSPKAGAPGSPASRLIDQRIRELEGWRGETLARVRALILAADPGVTEEWKWGGPVWSHGGIICTGETYTKVVKLTFARGAKVPDPSRLFNSSLGGGTRRALDIHEGDKLNATAFKALIRAAVAVNGAGAGKGTPVKLLSGGNPQIAKAEGDAPVQAYIAALSGWQRERAKRLDALIERTLPMVRKAVKWNSPFYGLEGRGWFLGVHTFTRYLKLAFFRGASLRPPPPGPSKDKNTRYLDIHEDDAFDEAQIAKWVKQAAKLPGWETSRQRGP